MWDPLGEMRDDISDFLLFYCQSLAELSEAPCSEETLSAGAVSTASLLDKSMVEASVFFGVAGLLGGMRFPRQIDRTQGM